MQNCADASCREQLVVCELHDPASVFCGAHAAAAAVSAITATATATATAANAAN
jgi:UPF0176 protein